MSERKRFLLPPITNTDDTKTELSISNIIPELKASRKVYGTDLQSSDILVTSTSSLKLTSQILECYGIGAIANIEQPQAMSSTSRKAIITTGNGIYFLKEKPQYSTTSAALETSAAFQDYLSNQTDLVPHVIFTEQGEPYVFSGNSVYLLTEYRAGRLFIGNSGKDLVAAGEALGLIHTLSKSFQVTSSMLRKNSYDDASLFINLANNLPNSDGDEWKKVAILALSELIEEKRIQSSEIAQNIPVIMNHGDFAPFNVIFGENGIVAINDFDNSAVYPRVRDFADALLTFGNGINYAGNTSSMRSPISQRFDIARVQKVYGAYCENAEPFSDLEIEYLLVEVTNRWAELMCLGLVRGDFNYYDVQNALGFQHFVEQNLKKVFVNS